MTCLLSTQLVGNAERLRFAFQFSFLSGFQVLAELSCGECGVSQENFLLRGLGPLGFDYISYWVEGIIYFLLGNLKE